MTYKKASQLKEEIFILSHLFLVANYAIEGEEKYNKQLAITIEDAIKHLIKTYSNKTYEQWQNIIAKLNSRVDIKELIGEKKSSHKFILAWHGLLQSIIDDGYNMPEYITDIFDIFLEIEHKQSMINDDWEALKKSADKKARKFLVKLKKEGLFT